MDSTAQQDLRQRHQALVAETPNVRIRERAKRLGVPEAALVALNLGVTAKCLRCVPAELFPKLGGLGRIMCLTRNAACVHERYGQFEDVQVSPKMGLVLGPDIDLRLFFDHWASAWVVEDGGRQSLQFFDRFGDAVHKIFRTDQTDGAAWEALVAEFAERDEVAVQMPAFEPSPPVVSDHGEVLGADQQKELRDTWLAMTDPHQFFPMLQKLKLSRITAIRNAGHDLAQQVPADTAETVLNAVSASGLPIMVFVGSRGTVQIHGGRVEKLMRTGPWFNVLDPAFNLHLDTTAIASAWIVHKPTDDGPVTSLELFADNGDLIAQFFGLRKPGNPELADWRALMVKQCSEPLHD
ncbi:MAG: ChuX/HutX family heme-like substrate-binding protein [Lautropia sp.]|nr:ChuX/HutX family heme-like substrate-binding protein [Lautropia sp.]